MKRFENLIIKNEMAVNAEFYINDTANIIELMVCYTVEPNEDEVNVASFILEEFTDEEINYIFSGGFIDYDAEIINKEQLLDLKSELIEIENIENLKVFI